MGQSKRHKLALKRETLRRLGAGELGGVAGGALARCTYEKSGCHAQDPSTNDCLSADCTTCCETKVCLP